MSEQAPDVVTAWLTGFLDYVGHRHAAAKALPELDRLKAHAEKLEKWLSDDQ